MISDDFQSTFSVIRSNTLSNMMSSKDFEEVESIIMNYMPDVLVTFTKSNAFASDYDIYFVQVSGS